MHNFIKRAVVLKNMLQGTISPKWIVLLIFGLGALAFSIKTLNLGYFHDDWHHVYYAYHHGLDGLRQFLFFDSRPFAYLVYVPYFSVLGYKAFNWHLLVIVLRVGVVLVFWFSINLVWPAFKKQNGLAAAFFLLYPVFQLQPHAVTYALHWTLYLVFMLSIFFMIRAAQTKKFFLIFTFFSLLLEILHLLMLEYFAGIELFRPLLLWFVFGHLQTRERLQKVAKSWLPYLILLIVYAIFRASYSTTLGYDRNTPVILFGLFTSPLDSLLFLAQATVQDSVDVLLATWNNTYDPASLNFSVFTNIWTWGFAFLSAFVSWVFFYLVRDQQGRIEEEKAWSRSFIVLGVAVTILGFLPSWIIGRAFFQMYDLYDDRVALPSMFGASMVWIGGLFYLLRKRSHIYLLVCVLLGLAVGLQLRTNVYHAQVWNKQSQFYWQLYWRAPYIEPGTALVSEGEILPLMGRHPTMYAINALYPKSDTRSGFGYSFFPSGKGILDWGQFRSGMVLEDDRFGSKFEGLSTNALTIFYLPEENQCLWVLRPEDRRIRNMPALTYETIPVSNVSRIQRESISKDYPLVDIFGPEPEHTWCYFYQKADLARQYGDWAEVTRLWDQAQQQGFAPGSGAEYIVFIEGFAYLDDWHKSAELTLVANKLGNNIRPALCETWYTLQQNTSPSASRVDTLSRVNLKLNCEIEILSNESATDEAR